MTTLTTQDLRKEARRRVEDREVDVIRREQAEVAEAERIEQVRVSTLEQTIEAARDVRSERATTLSDYAAARTRMIELGVQLREQEQSYGRLRTRAQRNGGSLEPLPMIKVNRQEEELIRSGISLAGQL